MALIHFVSHAKLNNFLTNQQHRIRDFPRKLLFSHIHAHWANIDKLHITKKIIHFGPLTLIGSTHKFSAIFSIIVFRPGLYRILGTTIILLPAILLSKRFPLHPISVDWIYKNRNQFIITNLPSRPVPSRPVPFPPQKNIAILIFSQKFKCTVSTRISASF